MLKEELIHRFQQASRNYSDHSLLMHEAIARKAGLSGTDHKYLGLIMEHEELTAGQIAGLTGLTTGAVTGLIDRLEKKELVIRKFSREDRRKVIIVPQIENAMKLLMPVFQELQEKTRQLLSQFGEEELKIIERYFVDAAKLMKEVTENLNHSTT